MSPKNNEKGSEEENEKKIEQQKAEIKDSANGLLERLVDFIKVTLSIREGVDKKRMLSEVQEDLKFQGMNVWVLMFSIGIASIGLNINSPAVIIGAMLISPLMGPIRGVGMGVATYDFKLLISALKNFGIAVCISLIVSCCYFWISPLKIDLSVPNELLARTTPTFLDALVACFGGFAGIVASTKGRSFSVISGVAIATALMPPLCTAGYGLAQGNVNFFFGAMYLFLLNSFFIALSTIVIAQYLKFPKKTRKDANFTKKSKRWVIAISILITLPSAWLFYTTVQESIFNNRASEFIKNEIKTPNPSLTFTQKVRYYSADSQKISIIFTNDRVSQEVITQWENKAQQYKLDKKILNIIQGDDISELIKKNNESLTKNLDNSTESILKHNEKIIENLENELELYEKQLLKIKRQQFNISSLVEQVESAGYQVNLLSVSKNPRWELGVVDTVAVVYVEWKNPLTPTQLKVQNSSLKRLVKSMLKYYLEDSLTEVKIYSKHEEAIEQK
jgi:uncharacterized hydrophobic protein (TIGR00271 family)